MTVAETQKTPGPLDIAQWRKAERARLIEARLAMSADQRSQWSEQIAKGLLEAIGDPKDRIISAYWPFRGEPALLPVLATLADLGAQTALPVVLAKGQPLIFRNWKSGDRLAHGVWKIPIPADGREIIPDLVIAPVVGFDTQGFRLGYGGGFFDRTLAAMKDKPRVFGVGYSLAAIATIHPQTHDIPMSTIITEEGVIFDRNKSAFLH